MIINETNTCSLCSPIRDNFQKDLLGNLVAWEQVALLVSTINALPSIYTVHSQREAVRGACLLLCAFELHVIESMKKLCVLLSSHCYLKSCYGKREMKGIERELLKEFK